MLIADGLAKQGRAASPKEQAQLIRFTGFGASDLANGMFRRPGEANFRSGWDELGASLETAVSEADYLSLARCTQYAHFTPEPIIRAIWSGVLRLGFRGCRVLEPGIGTGLFPALMPEALRNRSFVTGIELDPVTARIVRLLQPRARIIEGDFARTDPSPIYDLAMGNPPFSDRTVRSDRNFRAMGLRLHDYFIARSIDLLKPGGLAAFITSSGTMDKADPTARKHIAASANLVGAIRLPEGSFRADAGTDVVVDILFFRKRQEGKIAGDQTWLETSEISVGEGSDEVVRVNAWFAAHLECVLGTHGITSGPFGETYTCRAPIGQDLECALSDAIALLPEALYDGETTPIDIDLEMELDDIVDPRPDHGRVREGSYFIGKGGVLMQIVDGASVAVGIRKGRGTEGVFAKHAKIIRKLIPIRDAVREILTAQERDQPWSRAQVSLRIARSSFVREFGPINFTTVTSTEDPDRGGEGDPSPLEPGALPRRSRCLAGGVDRGLRSGEQHREAGPDLRHPCDRSAGVPAHHQCG